MATKNNPGKYDCYANAEPDEPMFVLLGRDKHAPTLVWLWSVLRELDGETAEKIAEARNCSLSMMEWLASKGKPVHGIAESVLAGVLEMMRAVNAFAVNPADAKNVPTSLDRVRAFLCTSRIEST